MTLEQFLFYSLGAVAVGSGLLVVTRRNPVMSVLALILNFFCLAGIYLTLNAQFIAVIQIIVYAGAIMVLFLFVVMLLNLKDERALTEGLSTRKIVAAGLGFGLLVQVLYILWNASDGFPQKNEAIAISTGTVEVIGVQLFTNFLFPFEITSLLLTVAIVGAVHLAKKKQD